MYIRSFQETLVINETTTFYTHHPQFNNNSNNSKTAKLCIFSLPLEIFFVYVRILIVRFTKLIRMEYFKRGFSKRNTNRVAFASQFTLWYEIYTFDAFVTLRTNFNVFFFSRFFLVVCIMSIFGRFAKHIWNVCSTKKNDRFFSLEIG